MSRSLQDDFRNLRKAGMHEVADRLASRFRAARKPPEGGTFLKCPDCDNHKQVVVQFEGNCFAHQCVACGRLSAKFKVAACD